uniref:Putative secreted protein n=1 Tax=Ixodes ricinus TaxID=34613 RepID=A0A6B0UJR1_IXORI
MPEPFWTLCVCAVLWICRSHFGLCVRMCTVMWMCPSHLVLPLRMCTVLWVLCRSHFDSVCVCCAVDVSKPFWTLCAHVYSDVDVPESSCTSFAHVYGVVSVMPERMCTVL